MADLMYMLNEFSSMFSSCVFPVTYAVVGFNQQVLDNNGGRRLSN